MLGDTGVIRFKRFALAHPVPEDALLAECLRAEEVARAVVVPRVHPTGPS